MRTPRVLLSLAALTVIAAAPVVSSTTAPDLATPALADACAADLGDAAGLVSDRVTQLPTRSSALGTELLVVVDPLVPPGIPHALLATPTGWCDVAAFNATPAALGTPADVAATFASVAAMPWLGEVTVSDVTVDGDTVRLTTRGGRHDATSAWTVEVDGAGVRAARFTTTELGIDPVGTDAHDLEGVTTRPGHTRSWTRAADGSLAINATILDDLHASIVERDAATARAAELVNGDPGDPLEHTFADGQTIRVTYGTQTSVDTGGTGVQQADRLRTLWLGMKPMYEDFMEWGVDDPWDNTSRTVAGQGTGVPDDAGYVNIDSGVSAYCFACAFLTDAIEIHMALLRPEVHLVTEGSAGQQKYEDYDAFYVDVMGHELVHSLQGGYGNGSGPSAFTNALVEGQARAAEALFPGAGNTFAPTTRPYYDNANGCEGFENGRGGWVTAAANGPFTDGHTYDACYFWWTYYANHGPSQLVRLWEQMPAALADRTGQDSVSLNVELLDLASPTGDGTTDLARWAAAFTAGTNGDGYVITGGDGEARDWFTHLSFAIRSQRLSVGSVDGTVTNAGVRGIELQRSGTILTLPTGAEAYVYDLTDGVLSLVGPATVGTTVEKGDILTVVAPDAGTFAGAVTIG